MNRRLLISCAVLLSVICVLVSIAALVGASLFIWRSDIAGSNDEQTEKPAEALVDSTPEPAPDPGTAGTISPQILAEMALIQRQVVQERGLEPAETFTRTLYTTDQLHQHVLDDFLDDYPPEEMAEDGIVLQAFGLLNADFDLYNFYLELFSENIAGFYDNENKEMVVVQGSRFGGIERLTYAHEYTHALQDQNYDIEDGLDYSEESCELDSERCAALSALLEGDATLSEMNWFLNHATAQDRTDIFSFSDTFETPVLDSAPAFIAQDFLFPYEEGYEFVQVLYDQGGWQAVDLAYANPPVSTEQILHPERYPDDRPIPVNLPDLGPSLGSGWEMIDQDVMGEWYTFLILAYGLDESARQDEKKAAKAAEGWGGDAYQVYYHPDKGETLMVLQTKWESTREAQEFSTTFQRYAQDRFGRPVDKSSGFSTWQDGSEYHRVYLQEAITTWILGPNQEIIDSAWTQLTQP
jgi:hypothetical protein